MEKVIIFNEKEFFRKKNFFINSGANNLHIVSDFDKTITKAFDNNKKVGTAIAQIRNNNYLGEEYTKKAFALFDKYHPFEVDESLTIKEKMSYMQEWWEQHLKLIISCRLNKLIINDIVEKDYLPIREELDIFFNFIKLNNLPLLILSSGLGDIIDGFLNKNNFNSPNIYVISNYFNFDENGYAIGYNGKIVHVFNKDESQIKGTLYEKLITNRKNVILLGDSIGDLKMVGQIHFDEIIKIGFLNENIKENLEEFKKHFDVVILNDGSFDFVNNLLKEIFK